MHKKPKKEDSGPLLWRVDEQVEIYHPPQAAQVH